MYDENDLINLMKKYSIYDQYFNSVTIDQNFFETNAINQEKLKFRDILAPIIHLVREKNTTFEIVSKIDDVSYLSSHKFFKSTLIIHHLENLAMYISINNDVPKPTEYEKILTEMCKTIIDDYEKLELDY